MLLYKAYPGIPRPRSTPARYAAVTAWKARLDAVAKGVGTSERRQARIVVLR